MFDFGWQEFIIVGFVLVMVVGPKDLPKVMRAITQVTGQARRMANEFRNGLQEIAADEKMKEVKQMVEDAKTGKVDDISTFLGVEDDEELKSIGTELETDIKSLQKDTKGALEKATDAETSDKQTS